MKNPSANQLYEYSQKCGEDGHEHLQKIMLIEAANLGYWKAVDLAKHEGIEIRRLARWEKKLIKSLKNEIHEHSAPRHAPNVHKKKKAVTSTKRKSYDEEPKEQETPLLDGIFGIIGWSFENPFNAMVSAFAFVAFLSVCTTLMFGPPENGGWPESDTPSTYSAKRYLKNSLKDPGSYDSISWGKVRKAGEGKYTVTHTYRAKNSFGGYVVDSATFVLDANGNVISMR